MSVITNKWNDGSGDSINIESPSFQGNQTIKISSPVQKGTSKRSMKFIGKCKKDSSKQVILTVEQEASTYTYDLTLNSDNTEIAAKGGTATITAVLKTYRNGNLVSTDNVTPVLSGSATGFSISGTKVTASNRTTTVGSRRSIVVTGKYSNTFDGQTVSSTITIYQESNAISYSDITITKETPINTTAGMHINIKVSDGLSYSQKAIYTSGSTIDVTTGANITYSVQNPVTGFTLSNNIVWITSNKSLNPRNGFVVRINVLLNGKTAIKDITYNQAAGYYTYAAPVVTFTCDDVPASGGSIKTGKVAYSQTYGWNGATTGVGVITDGEAYIYYAGGVDNIPSLGTTVKSRTKVGILSVRVYINNNFGDANTDIYQEANEAFYGALAGGSVLASDIPASGGTSSTSVSNMSQTISYTSGSTRAGTVTYSKTSEITVSSLGTTVKARTKVGQVTVTYTGEGSVTAKKTVDIYQAENKVTNSNYNPRITAYGTPTISIGSGLTAAGGSATVSASVTNTETYNALYSSGSTGPNQTRSVDGSLSISITVNGNSRFSLSGNTITHSSMGTNETTDTVTIKAVNNGDNSKSATASKSITNSKTVKSTSGGVYTYGNITAGIITNATIPASGGSATAKARNGSQTWNKSATVTTYQYTSGATKDVTTEAASSGTNSVAPSIASITATASSKGTTVSAQTTVKSQAVTWSANGKSASGTMYIYQEANAVIDDNYDEHLSSYGTPEMVIVSNLITAAGGTARVAGVVRNTYTYYNLYTSGSTVPYTRTKAGVYKIEMISNGNNRFSMDDTYLITHSSMGANVTTDTVKFRCYNESDRTKYVDDSISVSNRIESYNYGSWNIAISANPTTIAASGGTSTIKASCTRTKTPVYTSGSTGTATTESATPKLAISGAGFTLSGTTVTASKNNVAARTATVTASYSGATSKSVTITQSAGPDGIGYMQIQGNGVDHYIFQVGRTPNTRSNDVQTLSEEPAEVATETKSESLFAKIKRIVTNLN